ncbi:hypothetical protein I7I48_10355 [Histoplasma ohiense]|nr:hypothetical protein I7I48_10355 [Histoplasma ohiense (nom. inval.)]
MFIAYLFLSHIPHSHSLVSVSFRLLKSDFFCSFFFSLLFSLNGSAILIPFVFHYSPCSRVLRGL